MASIEFSVVAGALNGLNSRLVKDNGQIVEQTYKIGGRYTQALERVVYWLEKAVTVAENDAQRDSLQKLVTFYQTGDLADWDTHNIA